MVNINILVHGHGNVDVKQIFSVFLFNYMIRPFLPPANEVVIFSQVCVKNSVHGAGGGVPAWAGACSGGYLLFGGLVPGGPPGPHPRGTLRGIKARPKPKGEIEGDQSRPTPKGEIKGIRSRLPRRLLLRAARILLECILVLNRSRLLTKVIVSP